ncbi:MAG: ribonuclease P protein component [Verrucomicrobia bacterium GWF2_51_19]|nr:MAG: ribonuclease P protein component [Verrucomicrobia bacterium GWF2_51_19]
MTFLIIREKGTRVDCGAFILQCLSTDTGVRRFAAIVSKRVDTSSVVRNRVKRQFRELFRKHQEALTESVDLVVIARRTALDHPFSELERRFLKGVEKLNDH